MSLPFARRTAWIALGITFVVFIAITATLLLLNRSTPPRQAATVSKGAYIALGDSVAAGVGLQDYSDVSACDRTNQAYTSVLAKRLHYKLTSYACGSATVAAGIIGKQEVNKLSITAQLQALFADRQPQLVTMTIGANDVAWTKLLQTCYVASCGTTADTAAVEATLGELQQNLTNALQQFGQHYTTNRPTLVVTGYYQVFPTSATTSCADLQGIDASELAWGRQLQTKLNDAIRTTAASYSFVTFVPLDFAGHELCTSDPYVQGLSAKAAYHPTAAGQMTIAKQINAVLDASK